MASKKSSKKEEVERELVVLARYEIKQDYPPKGLHKGDVVLLVRNDVGQTYTVTLRRNKAHSCTCRANADFNRRCYHINTMRDVENARAAARVAASKSSFDKEPAKEPIDIGTRGTLNGNNKRGFSILRKSA